MESYFPFIFLALIFAMVYFLMIRPRQKQQKEHTEMARELRRGDKVITNSGISGQIESVSEDSVILKIESGATMKVFKGSIAGRQSDIQGESK